ncbi:MAG TPA: alpha/beta hydrolase [Caulobacteraceae bacterium]
MVSYMISLRAIGDDSALATQPRYLELDEAGNPSDLDRDAWRKAVLAWFPKNALNQPSGDLLFFVHGFNVGFASACKDHRDYYASLGQNGWKGLLVSFDWPSHGEVLQYYGDRSLARRSANELIDSALALFVETLTPDCDIKVSVMAHSMGAQVVELAFTWAHQDTKTNKKAWNLSQLIFVAGDVSEGSLSATQPGGMWIDKYVNRTTSYSNSYDSVLKISDIKNGDPTPRAGRVGLPDDAPASFCNVDTSAFYASLHLAGFNPATPHTYYFGQQAFWQDVVLTLWGGIDRKAIPTRGADPSATAANRFTLQMQPRTPGEFLVDLAHASLGATA